MASSSSSDPVLKPEIGGGICGSGSGGRGGGESFRGGAPFTVASPGIGGLVDMKLTFGIRVHGTRIRIRRESKYTWGAYDDEEAAARAYDLAALKYWGPGTLINFPVTDYTRDLEEMQNVSREEYLASLRRKSSGFSRGISKYRALSSRWDSSYSRVPGSEYFSNVNYGDDQAAESEYSFCIERKIDLTGYIKWWGSNKTRLAESMSKSSEDTKHGCADDIGSELKTSEREVQCTEPYQMPRLGLSVEGKRHKGSKISALSILSQSAAYKNLQEKASKKQETGPENDENENRNNINKMDHGKAVEKSTSHDSNSERLGAALGMTGGLSLQRNAPHPLDISCSFPSLLDFLEILRLQRRRPVQLIVSFGRRSDGVSTFTPPFTERQMFLLFGKTKTEILEILVSDPSESQMFVVTWEKKEAKISGRFSV
ncbi:hypothetical protein OIU76_010442 [Salix suchowensis]|nr:hypothetical protein OIU76_010442 [Salix suchowensis]